MNSIPDKKLVVFDLDGTLAESKSVVDAGMSDILGKLLEIKQVAVIGGGSHSQFTKQFLAGLKVPNELLPKLHLFPTCASQYYYHEDGEWKEKYADRLTGEEKEKILSAFNETFREHNYEHPEEVFGEIIEDRGTQITFSAVGQEAPVAKKQAWNEVKNSVRLAMAKTMKNKLAEFEVRTGGMTSIDVTRKGIDKAYGIRKIEELLGVPIDHMIFVGDALYPGGNDEPVKQAGVATIQVSGPEEVKKLIREWLIDNKQ